MDPIVKPPKYDKRVVQAVQALFRYAEGTRSEPPGPEDVKRALDWLVYQAGAYTEAGFRENDPSGRLAAWIDGRQFAAQQFIKLSKLNPEAIK